METRLHGVRALVTRLIVQSQALCRAIRAQGGEAVALPLITIETLADACAGLAPVLRQPEAFDTAIFSSANAVRHALACASRAGIGWPVGWRCLAIGAATRAALCDGGITAGSGVETMDSEELLEHPLLMQVAGRRIAVFRGEGGRGLLGATLRARGAEVFEFALYRRCAAAVDAAELAALLASHRCNALLAASGETLATLLGLLRQLPAGTIPADACLVVPGARVAGLAARDSTLEREVAVNATDAAMLDALARIASRPGRTAENR